MEYNKRTGYIFLKTITGNTKNIFDQIAKTDWAIGAWAVTGEYDIIAWVNAKNEEDLYSFANTLRTWEGVEFTNSHYVYNGFVENWDSLDSENGAWVRLRGHHQDNIPAHLKDYDFIGGWANITGDYDFLVWTHGDTTRATLENVLRMTENRNWRTFTHIPVYTYINHDFKDKL